MKVEKIDYNLNKFAFERNKNKISPDDDNQSKHKKKCILTTTLTALGVICSVMIIKKLKNRPKL